MFKVVGKVFENGNFVGKTAYIQDLSNLEFLIDAMDFDIEDGRYLKVSFVFVKEEEND